MASTPQLWSGTCGCTQAMIMRSEPTGPTHACGGQHVSSRPFSSCARSIRLGGLPLRAICVVVSVLASLGMRFDVAAHQRHMATRVQRNNLKHTLTAQLRKGQAHCPKTFHPNRSQDCIPGGSVRSAGGAAQLEIGRDCLCGQRAHHSRRQDRASFGEVRPRPGAGALQIVVPCCLAQVPFRLVRLPRHNLSRYRFAQPRRCCFARHVDRGNGIQKWHRCGFILILAYYTRESCAMRCVGISHLHCKLQLQQCLGKVGLKRMASKFNASDQRVGNLHNRHSSL